MADVVLTASSCRGRVETARLILAFAAADYQDIRLQWGGEKMVELEANGMLRYGELPMLFVDGEQVHKAMPICRMLARMYGLTGINSLQSGQIDEVVDALNDVLDEVELIYRMRAVTEKDAKMKEVIGTKVRACFVALEKRISVSGDGLSLTPGCATTWAELHLVNVVDLVKGMANSHPLPITPRLQILLDRTRDLPNIASWLKKRPNFVL